MITYWGTFAETMVRACAWKGMWQNGVYLYIAHSITLAAQNALTASLGGTPGTFGGVANNKTVGSASIAYDSQATAEKDAGFWNLTNYGKEFWRLSQIFGAGGVQLL